MLCFNNAFVIAVYRQRFVLFIAVLFILLSNVARSEPTFPELTGRIVDNANMLDHTREQRIKNLLTEHENATTNQVVVVTLLGLGGYDIETYGYQLGRAWEIGQEGKDNGVLLIVAKKERKVRIEVGYGLEGTLTDAISAHIINRIIVPKFKQGKFGKGIEKGTAAIIQALSGQYSMTDNSRETDKFKAADKAREIDTDNYDSDNIGIGMIMFLMYFAFIVFGLILTKILKKFGWEVSTTGSSSSGGGYSGGSSSSGGGYSGGGGSFGGGGASGSW